MWRSHFPNAREQSGNIFGVVDNFRDLSQIPVFDERVGRARLQFDLGAQRLEFSSLASRVHPDFHAVATVGIVAVREDRKTLDV